jgi:hypothetical protein
MNKVLLVGFLLAIATQSLGQGIVVQNSNPTSSIANRGSYIADSIFRIGTRDTVKPSWWNPAWSFNGALQIGLDGKPYYYFGGYWRGVGSGASVTSITQGYGMALSPSPIVSTGSVSVDTTAISTKANVNSLLSAKLNISDTSAMLIAYLRKADTASLSNRINLKLNISDTNSMLGGYLRKVDTSSLSTRIDARVKYVDTAAMLAPYATDAQVALKLNITDTANMRIRPIAGSNMTISGTYPNVTFASTTIPTDSTIFATNYRVDTAKANLRTSINTKLNSADTASLSNRINLKLNSADTASLSNRINLKLNSADTASLSTRIEARVKYSDTSTMLGGYLRKVDTASLSNRINAKGSGTITSIATTNGTGITGGTITTTGTLAIDTALISTRLWRQKGIDSVNTQLALKANIASPTFTGTVTIPTGANITTPNILSLTSGTTNDSLVVADATSGALRRISSSRVGLSGLTTNYVPKATSATAIGNSQIFDDGTLVGVGTATPTTGFKLDVNGRLKATSINFGTSNTLNPTSTAHIIGESATIETGASYVSALGGFSNTVKSTSYISSILGGNSNTVSGTNNNIAASISVNMTGITGQGNQAVASNNSAIFAGSSARNSFIGANASVINTNKNDNIVMGYNIFAQHDGNFMLGDRASIGAGYLNSTADNRFMSRFQNGYDFKLANNVTALFINSTAQIGIGTTTPNASAIFDIVSTTQGLGLPSMTTTQQNAIATPRAGLAVYNSTLSLPTFYNGTAWSPYFSGWSLTGNAGTSDATNFIGTTDGVDVIFKRNNVVSGRLNDAKQVTSFGVGALPTTSTGDGNTAFGWKALNVSTSGGANTALGFWSLRLCTTGFSNSAVGQLSLGSLTTGFNNCAFGEGSGQGITSGTSNTFYGNGSGNAMTTGADNIGIGLNAMSTSTAGSKNLVISASGAVPSTTGSNQLNIGNVLWGVNCSGTNATAAGRLGVGTNAPNASALLDLTSTTQGLLLPRMTTTEINAIASPAAGLMVYNTTINHPCFYNGTAWQRVSHSPM